MEIRDLLLRPESEWLDFKQQYHDNIATFLHDVRELPASSLGMGDSVT
jgi:hypothetical protein